MTTRTRNLLATATYTLKVINDGPQGPEGPQGPTGPQGPQGEAKDYYDASFMDGKKYWSTSYSSYVAPGSNVMVAKEATSKLSGNVLQIQNEQWLYAKNKIAIEQNKIYKFVFRVRQIQDPLNDASKNKVYAGATTFNANGDRLSQNNGSYFIASSQSITVANGWREYTAYMSTTARSAIVNSQNQTLCPAVKAFETGTVAIKPMFIVNYAGGNGIAQVDYLTMEDYTETWNVLNKLSSKLDDDFQSVFDALTSDGTMQGIFLDENGHLYINGQYINAKKLRVYNNLDSSTPTFEVTHDGNVNINALNLKIGGIKVPHKNEVDGSITDGIDKISIEDRNLILNSTWNYDTKGWSNVTAGIWTILEPENDKPFSNIIKATATGLTANGYYQIHCTEIEQEFVNKDIIVSFDMKVKDKSVLENGNVCVIRAFNEKGKTSQADSVWDTTFTIDKNTIPNEKWVRYSIKVKPTAGKFLRIAPYLTKNGEISFREIKASIGTKQGAWSPAPEDLEDQLSNKPNNDEIIENINKVPQTEVQIEADRVKLKGYIEFSHLSNKDGGLGEAFKLDEYGKTIIDGGKIETGSVIAEKLDVYKLVVKKRSNTGTAENPNWVVDENKPTFSISEEGNITASGTFKSFNYKDGTNIADSEGWMITEEGDSIFNNTIVRGRVELPNAGITDYGGKGNLNLLKNTDLKNGTTGFSLASGVTLDKTFTYDINNTFKYVISGLTADGWRSATPTSVNITVGQRYSASAYVYLPTNHGLDSDCCLEIQWYDNSNTRISTQTKSVNKNITNAWQRVELNNVVAPANAVKANARVWVQRNGSIWVANLKLEKSTVSTEWACAEGEKMIRFWAGKDYANRDEAPFKVLQDGSIFATEGTFGGTFTGNLKIGNIEIVDEVGTADEPVKGTIKLKDDTNQKVIIQVGEESSWFNSPIYFGDGDKAKIKVDPSTNTINLSTGSTIKLDSGKSSIAIKNDTNDAYLLFGDDIYMSGTSNTLNIYSSTNSTTTMNIGLASKNDSTLTINGNLHIKDNFYMSGLRVTYVKNGVDFIVSQ